MKRQKIGVLFSGGIDSCILLSYYAGKGYVTWPIYVTSGLPWEKSELQAIHNFLKQLPHKYRIQPLQKIRLSLENAYQFNWSTTGKTPGVYSKDSSVFLPARNLLLITKACLYLYSKKIYSVAIGSLDGNPFKDGQLSYFKSLSKILSRSFDAPINIQAPFRKLSKQSLIKRFVPLPLHLSFSCIHPLRNKHCGQCNKCAERKKNFRKVGFPDRTIYCS